MTGAIAIIGSRSVPAAARAIISGSARRCGCRAAAGPSCGKSIPTEVTSAPATRVCISGWATQPLLASRSSGPAGRSRRSTAFTPARFCCWMRPMRSAESLRYNLTVPLRVAVLLFASAMAWAQTPSAEQGAQLGAAAQHLQQGKVEQAIRECKAVLAADPRLAPAHMLLGLAYIAQRSTAMMGEAKAELQQALDLDPELLWARFYLARLYLDLGLSEKAQEQLERGLKQRPGFPVFLSLLGEVRRKLGDPGASVELHRKALDADPTMTPAHYFLALAYLDLKQEHAAIAEFEKAIHSPSVTPEMYNALASLYIKKQ